MAKRIPTKVNDTIVKALFQVRFSLKIKAGELLGHWYPILIKDFPKLEDKTLAIPLEIARLDPQFKSFAGYQFSNPDFVVGVGTNVLTFEYLSSYKGWNDFYSKIEKVLASADTLDIFKRTERVGLRYINLVDASKPIDQVIDFKFDFSLSQNLSEKNLVFRKEFHSDGVRTLLNIAENAAVRTADKSTITQKGIVIDLDVASTTDLPRVGSELLPIAKKLHTQEKFIFFNILRQEFIESLQPTYN